MASGGEGDETGGPGGTRGYRGIGPNASGAAAGRNHGLQSGSRKRKTVEAFEATCEDSQRISIEIENLRSRLDEDVKELGYYEENEKLRVEMDLKNKEVQRLRNQTEELQAKYKDLLIKYEEQSEEELNTRIITWSCKTSTRASIIILQSLENQIDTKRTQLHHLERLYSAMEFPSAQLEEGKRIPDKSCNEDAGEISGGNNGKHQGEQPLRIRRKVAANRHRVQADDEFQVQDDMDQDVNLLGIQNENLRLQIALRTKELELEESRRVKLELILKTNENESLLKQNEELKAENEQLKKTAKPPRARRFCRSCQSYEFHDSATALRSHKLLGLLKKRSLTN